MRVLHVYRTYFPDPPGGLQEAVRQICLSVEPHGFENVVFALSSAPMPEVIERPEARVVRGRSWAAPASCDLGDLAAVRMFARWARWADLIHYHFPWPFADLLNLVCPEGTPSVLTYHSDIVRQRVLGRIYLPLMKRTLGSVSSIVATSPAYARTSRVLTDPSVRDRVKVIPLGIDERSYAREANLRIFSKLGLNQFECYFLFIGVLRYYKGLHSLVRAATKVGAKIVIAGSGPEGEPLRALARAIGADNVIFAGQVSDEEKTALLQHCRALVLPSHLRSEAYGMVLVEAAMFRKPMVSCEIGTGTSYVNADNETGFVVPPEQPAALAHAMNRLLIDERLADRMGRDARSRYERLFSGHALGRGYAELFQEVAKR